MTRGRAASLRARLRGVARQRDEDFNLTLNGYAVERYLYRLSKSAWADRNLLVEAIRATFDRRGTPIPEGIPPGLGDEFANSPAKIALWKGFLDRNRLEAPTLSEVVVEVSAALAEPMRLARERSSQP